MEKGEGSRWSVPRPIFGDSLIYQNKKKKFAGNSDAEEETSYVLECRASCLKCMHRRKMNSTYREYTHTHAHAYIHTHACIHIRNGDCHAENNSQENVLEKRVKRVQSRTTFRLFTIVLYETFY